MQHGLVKLAEVPINHKLHRMNKYKEGYHLETLRCLLCIRLVPEYDLNDYDLCFSACDWAALRSL